MSNPRTSQAFAERRSGRRAVAHARCSWRIGLAYGCLLLAAVPSVVRPAVQADLLLGGAPPLGAVETTAVSDTARLPRVIPDYLEVVLPPNVAPLNFTIQEAGIEYELRVSGSGGPLLEVRQTQPNVRLPLRQWKELLEANRGNPLSWNIAVRAPAGEWTRYAPFTNRVAEEEIDPYVLYRRLRPLYSTYKHLGVYQRHLETFEETPVLRNETIGQGCVNCHTFQQGAPDRFAISFRGRFGTPTILWTSNRLSRIDAKLGYLSWHPNGKLLAFAANEITQFFHVAGPMNRDVYDVRSDLGIVHLDDHAIEKPPVIAAPDRNENWPCWASDGRHLYYCDGPTVPIEQVRNFRYDLLRIPYDPDQNRWGKPELVVSSAEHRFSAHQPRVSPDGRYLVFTASESGSFPLFRPESDLFLLRLDSRKVEPLPIINSDQTETWHCWSSNGRWLLFGSRRLDGVFARLFIAHVDPEGCFSKPLLLPQEDPTYYDTCLDNFNAPELARGPLQITEEELARVVNTPVNKPGPNGRETSAAKPALDGASMMNGPQH
jgi:hypothetical protein